MYGGLNITIHNSLYMYIFLLPSLADTSVLWYAASSNASAALELPPDVVARAWADIARPSEVAKQRLALRALAAAARYGCTPAICWAYLSKHA